MAGSPAPARCLEALFEGSPIGITTADLENRFTRVNRAFAAMVGYEPEELVGRTFAELTHPEDLEASHDVARQALQDDAKASRPVLLEKRYLHRSGRTVQALVTILLVRDADGQPLHFVGQMVDVTEQRRMEQALREGEDRFRRAVERAPLPVLLHAEGGEILAVSEGWTRSSGYSPGQLRTIRDWVERAYGPDADTREAIIKDLYRRDPESPAGIYAGELQVRVADGRARTWNFVSAPLGVGADGRRLAISMARDVTERLEAEAALQESERRYRLLAENASDVIWVYDHAASRFSYVSPSITRLRGLTVEQALAERIEDALTPASLARATGIAARFGEPGGLGPPRGAPSITEVFEQPCQDGSTRLVEMTMSAVLGEDGRQLATVGVSRDVTERMKALEAERMARTELDRQFHVLRGVLDGSEAAIFSVDRDYRYTSFNRVHASIMKALYGVEIGPGLSLLEAQTVPEDRERAKANLDRTLAGERVVEEAFSGEPGPNRRYFEVTHHPIFDAGGEIIGAAVFGRDLTTRRQAELTLKRTVEALERSNADLEQFAYAASHDLQEPLRTIASFLQLLEQRAGPALGQEHLEYLGFARQGASRLQRLVADLLTFSRVGRAPAPPETFPAGEVIEAAISNLGTAISERGAQVAWEGDYDVRASRSQVVLLLQNLVGNALKFHGDRPPRVEVKVAREGAWLHWLVRDEGIGIDPRFHERIFGLFQRLQPQDRVEGTGIGLAVAKRIVERHGGRIWVDSTPGRGATFHFHLPAAHGGKEDV